MFQTTNQFIIHLPHFFPDILGGSTTNYPKFTIKNHQFWVVQPMLVLKAWLLGGVVAVARNLVLVQ
jgi:hypothetical protein